MTYGAMRSAAARMLSRSITGPVSRMSYPSASGNIAAEALQFAPSFEPGPPPPYTAGLPFRGRLVQSCSGSSFIGPHHTTPNFPLNPYQH